jgi:hypothetical protein
MALIVRDLRQNVETRLPRGLSARELEDIVNTELSATAYPGAVFNASERGELALLTELYSRYFSADGAAYWKKLTGIVVTTKGITYPQGFVNPTRLAEIKKKVASEGEILRAEWAVSGSRDNLSVTRKPLTMELALAKLPVGNYIQIKATSPRGRRLSWIFTRSHRTEAARCLAYLTNQGWRDLYAQTKYGADTSFKHMWNPSKPPYR